MQAWVPRPSYSPALLAGNPPYRGVEGYLRLWLPVQLSARRTVRTHASTHASYAREYMPAYEK